MKGWVAVHGLKEEDILFEELEVADSLSKRCQRLRRLLSMRSIVEMLFMRGIYGGLLAKRSWVGRRRRTGAWAGRTRCRSVT
jgi:hypothetical protein